MNAWWYLVIALAIGLPLLALAALVDWRSRVRRNQALSSAPDRDIPHHDGPAPHYIPADDVLSRPVVLAALSSDEASRLDAELADATRLPVGWASDRFATHRDPVRAMLSGPLVLVCDEVSALRELLTPLQRARQLGRPLVIVAERIDPAVIDTLVANRLRLDLGLLAVVAPADVLDSLRSLLGTPGSTRTDLQAGYLPATALIEVQRWVADRAASWIVRPQP